MTLLALALTATAAPGGATPAGSAEIAIVLDNSTSMVAGGTLNGVEYPANDPGRIAQLGALVIEGLVRGSDDAVTVYGFDEAPKPAPVARDANGIRNMEYVKTTLFLPALTASRDVFAASSRDRKVLVLLTDGSPNDVSDPSTLLDLLAPVAPETIAIGFYRDAAPRAHGEGYLRPLVADPADYHGIDPSRPDAVGRTLEAFTTSYARVLGSRPETGTLPPGATHRFTTGRYVTEVLVAVASREPGALGAVELSGPRGAVPARATGDNGCEHERRVVGACDPPRRHYATFRAPVDPTAPSAWELSVPASSVTAEFGVILHYELGAELQLPPRVRVGDAVPLTAKLVFRGEVADDPDIFGAPGFGVTVRLGDDEVMLSPTGGGLFTGTWTPTAAGGVVAEVAFASAWLDVRARQHVVVSDFVPLTLAVPDLDVGSWTGERGRSRRCADLDLSASSGVDRVPLRCTPSPVDGVTLTCTAVAGSEATLPDGSKGEPGRWEVCAEVQGCCDALPAAGQQASVALQGDHAHYDPGAVRVPVRFEVAPTGFLRCWWMELCAVAGMLFAGWVVVGFTRPSSFDPGLCVRIASKEAALKRATALVLAEAPGGRRGFYRNARFAVMADGTPTRAVGRAAWAVQAGPRGRVVWLASPGLERQDRRTRAWSPVEGGEVETGTLYRIGGMIVKFG